MEEKSLNNALLIKQAYEGCETNFLEDLVMSLKVIDQYQKEEILTYLSSDSQCT